VRRYLIFFFFSGGCFLDFREEIYPEKLFYNMATKDIVSSVEAEVNNMEEFMLIL